VKKVSSKNQQNLADYSEVVWSSAKIMHYMISSQMTHTKINMNQLKVRFERPKELLVNQIVKFLEPFAHPINQKNLSVEIV